MPKRIRGPSIILDDDDDENPPIIRAISEEMSQETPRNTNEGSQTRTVSPAKHWCFTWNQPYQIDEMKKWAAMSLIQKLVVQEEMGEQGTYHLQGYLMFAEKQRPMTVFKEEKRIHWEVCRNPDASIQYCSKLSTRVEDGFSLQVGVTIKESISVITPMGWQKDLVKRIPSMEPRNIYWYWEPSGNKGKSALCKYLCVKHGALILAGKSCDMKAAIASMKEKPKLIVMDIPRSSTKYVSYTGIEEVSNGCFFSGKYEGGMVLMENPKIIVFANAEPDYHEMSHDRWKVTDIRLLSCGW